jgi:hypothetical protein
MQEQDLKRWQRILSERFPGIVVRPNVRALDGSREYFLDIFFIPDAATQSFTQFLVDETWSLAKKRNLPRVNFVPHSVSATRKYYPEVKRN